MTVCYDVSISARNTGSYDNLSGHWRLVNWEGRGDSAGGGGIGQVRNYGAVIRVSGMIRHEVVR
jgi:hypothetical protein